MFNMRAIIILAFIGTAFAGPRAFIGNRIIGGSDTTIEVHPYMVNMQFSLLGIATGFTQRCGGTLITERTVLSAGHCFDDWPIAEWHRACLGNSFRSVCAHAHVPSNIIFHPQYNGDTLHFDAAILRLRVAAVQSQTVRPARIAGPNYNLADGTPVTTIGWGHTEYRGRPSEQLQDVVVNTINQELCAARYAYLKTQPNFQRWPDITDAMLCAGVLDVGGKDGCQGDSGGPVIHGGDVLVGITSWGFECAHSYYPGVLARVSRFADWVVANQ